MKARILASLLCITWLSAALLASAWPATVAAIGERTVVDLRALQYDGGNDSPRPTAMKRLAWEVRQRTSVDTRLDPTRIRLSDPAILESPFLYWAGDQAFPRMSEAEINGLRRFVDFGGFVVVDDASADEDTGTQSGSGFDASVRRELARAFGTSALAPLPEKHVAHRSFYLVQHPVGRVEGPKTMQAVMRKGRAALIYVQNDLGGALERDDVGNYTYDVLPGGMRQREMAQRLAVNLVLYALCLDYKDDQVHAPFIMRRWAGGGDVQAP